MTANLTSLAPALAAAGFTRITERGIEMLEQKTAGSKGPSARIWMDDTTIRLTTYAAGCIEDEVSFSATPTDKTARAILAFLA